MSRGLERALALLPTNETVVAPLDAHSGPLALGRALHERIVQALASRTGEDAAEKQLALANRVLELLRTEEGTGVEDTDELASPPTRLLAVLEPAAPPAAPRRPTRPVIPLGTSDLLVNGPHDLSLGPELRREIESADRIDVLCSFLKWSGLRLVMPQLRAFVERCGADRMRVLTTAYMLATEARALDELAALGVPLRVSYDRERTRLHAKAWMIHRESGFSTAFVGSSNLSSAAMLDGLEWNVRLARADNAAILDKFSATFEQYWSDAECFLPYDRERFLEVVERGKRSELAPYLLFDVEPRPHQREILDALAAERAHGHTRNLVVAATGTGKTIVAALDYKRLRSELLRARLLFVAHRREILEQSLTTFRVVLRDGAFGEMLVAGASPDRWEHVFASVQSLHDGRLEAIPKDAFDVVIVDEFHHAAAATYQSLLEHLRPRVLLGLTATPERADGQSVLGWFDHRTAAELRLWKALDQGLLAPFQYFGIGCAPDVSGVKWSRGRYDVTSLSNVYSADDLFALRVFQETGAKVANIQTMRALGFCVDVAHAERMAREFQKRGVASAAVSAQTPGPERKSALAALARGDLACIFSVDLFNEGVDLPDVDTVLFLRPTESATVFLQQLGRGLRRSERKSCLTVLDFVGGAHRRFRFDQRYRAIVGGTRKALERTIESEFPSLPSGCSVQLDRQAQEVVLANLRAQLGVGAAGLIEDLRELAKERGSDVTLSTFLAEAGADLEDVYAGHRCWTSLRRAAGLEAHTPTSQDESMERALTRMLHIDDELRLDGIRRLLSRPSPPAADSTDPVQRLLFVSLGFIRRPYAEMTKAWRDLWSHAPLRNELEQLLTVLEDRVRHQTFALRDSVLRVHGTYSLDEVLAAFDERGAHGGLKRIQTGVFPSKRANADLLFVTLEKSENEYSPTTLYKDYALSPTRFHWESQSNCHAETPMGKRHVDTMPGRNRALLFVRPRRHDARGVTMPYVCLGDVYCASARGGRPMQIEWELAMPMPARFYQETKVAAG